MAEPLSREERVNLLRAADISVMRGDLSRTARRAFDEFEATVQAAEARIERLEGACALTVREMEAYYRDGRHPDLSIVLRASKAALAASDESARGEG